MPSELLFSRSGADAWAVVIEAGRAVEIRYAKAGRAAAPGDIFLARVDRWVPGLEAAFVDLGIERNAFLPARQAPAAGESLPVQVVRAAVETKGPEVTARISLGGRYVVCFPLGGPRSLSKRIAAGAPAERLAGIVAGLAPAGAGFVARSAAIAASAAEIRAEAEALVAEWTRIGESARGGRPRLLRPAGDLLARMLDDAPAEGFDRTAVDDPADFERLEGTRAAGALRLHTGAPGLLAAAGLQREFEAALSREVPLPSGGSLFIEPTAALVAIDVNSGAFVSGRSPEETARVTNLEAAVEIARQLRLRDLGGIVVVDFLNLRAPEDRRVVQEKLEWHLRAGGARARSAGWTRLGLFELARERKGEGWAQDPGADPRNLFAARS